jgi:hypothetical protein
MALQLPIKYEQLIELVEQLSEDQQKDLITRLLTRNKLQTPSDRLVVFQSMSLNLGQVLTGYSDHRADWYNEDRL